MTTPGPRILLVEDSEQDFIITQRMLLKVYGEDLHLDRAATVAEGAALMRCGRYDVHLIDYNLGVGTGLELLTMNRTGGDPVPQILLTGSDDHRLDMEAMEAGAAAYLDKNRLSPEELGRTIRFAVKQRATEKELAEMAYTDPLTGLANRLRFHDRLADALAWSARSDMACAVLLIDLDHFKQVNDTMGHAEGDHLLRQVADRLRQSLRSTDTVARLGGDEFAAICTNLRDPENVCVCAAKILEALSAPFHLDGGEVHLGASIGIAQYPADADDPVALLRRADSALYHAKSEGRGCYRMFNVALDVSLHARQSLEAEMRHALDHHEFRLWMQPRLRAADGALVGAEALIRWQHPERGLLQPAEFLPVAEKSALMQDIGAWVLDRACSFQRRTLRAGHLHVPLAINLSAAELGRHDLVPAVAEAMERAGLKPGDLELEFGERALANPDELLVEKLTALRGAGFRIAVDDVGAADAALVRLKDLPVDRLKIDRAYVGQLEADEGIRALTRALIGFAHELGLGVTAEGVETVGQSRFLRAHGCDEMQGFLLAPPMPDHRYLHWCRRRTVHNAGSVRTPRSGGSLGPGRAP